MRVVPRGGGRGREAKHQRCSFLSPTVAAHSCVISQESSSRAHDLSPDMQWMRSTIVLLVVLCAVAHAQSVAAGDFTCPRGQTPCAVVIREVRIQRTPFIKRLHCRVKSM